MAIPENYVDGPVRKADVHCILMQTLESMKDGLIIYLKKQFLLFTIFFHLPIAAETL